MALTLEVSKHLTVALDASSGQPPPPSSGVLFQRESPLLKQHCINKKCNAKGGYLAPTRISIGVELGR